MKVPAKIVAFIETLTAKTGIDLTYLLKGGSWLLSEQALLNVISLLQAVAFANLMDPENYGIYSVVQSWMGIFSTFAIGGLTNALVQSVSRGNDGELQRGIKLRLKFGLISSALALGFSFYYLYMGNNVLALSFLFVSVLMPFNLAFTLVSPYLTGKTLFNKRMMVEVGVSLTTFVALVSTLYFTDYVPYLIGMWLGAPAIAYFLFTRYVIKHFQKNRHTDPDTTKFALHLTGMNLSGTIYKNLDQLLLFHTGGAVELAVYKFALVPIRKVQSIFQIALDLALPRFAKRSYEEIYENIDKKLILSGLISTVAVGGFVFMIPYLYSIFFPKYTDATVYSQLLALLFIFTPVSFLQQLWLAKVETKRLYFLKILGDASRIICFIVFIPLYGIMGAVGTRMGVSVLVTIISYIIFVRDRKKYVR